MEDDGFAMYTHTHTHTLHNAQTGTYMCTQRSTCKHAQAQAQLMEVHSLVRVAVDCWKVGVGNCALPNMAPSPLR